MVNILQVSRPRFWIYLLGPFLLGSTAALLSTSADFSPLVLALGVYFTWPANLFIYGVNDVYDFDTDKLNNKKAGYETTVQVSEHQELKRLILRANIVFLPLVIFMNWQTMVALVVFVVLGYAYSAPPVRAKARPGFDSLTNILYVMPGLVGYFAGGGQHLSWLLVLAAALWSMAMHAYSAVPDIAADSQAGLRTIATTLGGYGTLFVCLLAYATAGVIAGLTLGLVGWIGLVVYVTLMLISFIALSRGQLMTIYKQFPLVNTAMGAALFVSLFL